MKILFIFAALIGMTLVFFTSWFWRLLLIPIIVIILVDVFKSGMKKEK